MGLFISFGLSSLRYKICVDTSELSSGDGEVRWGGEELGLGLALFIFFFTLKSLIKGLAAGRGTEF